MTKKLSTDAYKGTRDFYPEEMAIQRYIFDTWAKTAESFGFERYDASILEPSELYKSKGAENEEMVNEQTYTFIDRGDREVTLRPEMTPTVARMVSARRRELSFPVRWYSIPNLFRYERPQRGRLREFWQLNCDMFGISDLSSDIEIIALVHKIFMDFGANDTMFEIRINSRRLMQDMVLDKLADKKLFPEYLRLIDRKAKMKASEFKAEEKKLLKPNTELEIMPNEEITTVISSLNEMGVSNVVFDASITRGFNYYTGLVFEVFDTSPENNRAMMGGGRFDNLTELFGGDAISGIGFGMGDVIMHDFLETHKLLPKDICVTAPTLIIIPTDSALNLEGEKIAQVFRTAGIRTSVDLSTKKIGKKLSSASDAGAQYVLVVGEDEVKSQSFTLKELATKKETKGAIQEFIAQISSLI